MDMIEILPEGRIYLLKNIMRGQVAGAPAGYSSRLEYWEKASGIEAGECAHEACRRPATEGAIATRAFSTDKTMYVFPACETCARRTEMLYVKGPLARLEIL